MSLYCTKLSSLRRTLREGSKSLKTWIPRGLIVRVVQACHDQRKQYEEHDIEYIFYEHEDINGLLVLHLGSRSHIRKFNSVLIIQSRSSDK